MSGLKPNLTKSEIAGIGVLKVVQVAVCGMCCLGLNNDTLKILGTYCSYNEKLKEKKFLWDCDRYSASSKNMENEKPYTRKKNRYF